MKNNPKILVKSKILIWQYSVCVSPYLPPKVVGLYFSGDDVGTENSRVCCFF